MSVTITRSGRIIKKPVYYEPEEICEDDYSDDEDIPDDDEDDIPEDDDDDEEEDDDDADENGNLKDFVVEDEESEKDEDT
jgi:hypothetical protein